MLLFVFDLVYESIVLKPMEIWKRIENKKWQQIWRNALPQNQVLKQKNFFVLQIYQEGKKITMKCIGLAMVCR